MAIIQKKVLTTMKLLLLLLNQQFAFSSYMSIKLYQMDVKYSFLNGYLQEQVYVKKPSIFVNVNPPNNVFKLNKALYALKQAPKAQYMVIRISILISNNSIQNLNVGRIVRSYLGQKFRWQDHNTILRFNDLILPGSTRLVSIIKKIHIIQISLSL